MKFDVYADLDHLFMLNFSAEALKLQKLLPPPLKVLERRGRGFPSIVLPRIRNLRPVKLGFLRVDYELFGLRILVEYDSKQLGKTKGIYFKELIMDPNWVRQVGNMITAFDFKRGAIVKRSAASGVTEITVTDGDSRTVASARVKAYDSFPNQLTPGSAFKTPEEALTMYNDIAYGFLPDPSSGAVHILQIAEPHPDYVAWPLMHLEVMEIEVSGLHGEPILADGGLTLEPSYFVSLLARYWRWCESEKVYQQVIAPVPAEVG